MTALDRLIEKYKSGADMTPIEHCILEQPLEKKQQAIAAAAELELIDDGRAVNARISEERRLKIERLEKYRDSSVCIACQREHNMHHV